MRRRSRSRRSSATRASVSSQANESPEAKNKRKLMELAEPASPGKIMKSARRYLDKEDDFKWQEAYPKMFQYQDGELNFSLHHIMQGLTIEPTKYAPKLHRRMVSEAKRLVYEIVQAYNHRWLKKDRDGNPKPKSEYVPFEPATVWSEER